jgi:predicted porin
MKKALIALAVLGAASGAALAQSSVTLYGVADIAIGKARAGGDVKWGAQSNSVVTNGTSRIGLTGREDLGGGLWAGFRFESPVNLATGSTGANTWSREANVQMGSNNFGTVKFGRSLTPSYYGAAAWELTGMANYSVVVNTYGWGAYPNPRSNVQLDYKTPSFAGLSAELAYVPKADGALLDNGVANQTDRWDFNLIYAGTGPVQGLTLALTANKAQKTTNSQYGNKANYTLGGQYKFHNTFALAASYNRANSAPHWQWVNHQFAGGTSFGKRYGFSLGGSVYMNAFTLTLDLTRDTKNDMGVNRKKYTNGLVEGKYALSKRTFLYADYTRLDNTNNYGLGVRHNF